MNAYFRKQNERKRKNILNEKIKKTGKSVNWRKKSDRPSGVQANEESPIFCSILAKQLGSGKSDEF